MNLEAVAPLIEKKIKELLSQKVYPFGFDKYKGLSNKVATGNLRNSIQAKVVNRGEISVIQILALDYFQWVQSGRLPNKGKVPITALEQWIKARGLTGRDKKGRFIKRKSFAFAIQTNIKKFGIRPANFLDKAIDDLAEDQQVRELIGDAAFEELLNLIEGL